MEAPRFWLLIVLLLFIYFTPEQPNPGFKRFDTIRINDRHQQESNVLTNSSYGDLDSKNGKWLNLTGFRQKDNYSWTSLPKAQDLSRSQWKTNWQDHQKDDELPIYSSFTGDLRGDFHIRQIHGNKYVNLTETDPSKEYVFNNFHRNITEDGEIEISIEDSSKNNGEIKADLNILTKSAPGTGWHARLQGVHLSTGMIILSTSSSKFDALPALPQFALDEKSFQNITQIINQTLIKSWDEDDDSIFGLAVCELILWLQPVFGLESSQYLQDVENELENPQGAPIGNPPPMIFSAIMFSPDCDYILESDVLVGIKIEHYRKLATYLLLSFVLILTLEIVILKRQMEKSSTPSTRSRISYQSIAILTLGDGLLLFAFIALLIVNEATFLIVSTAAFLSVMHVVILEVKFIFDIWTVQVGDPARAEYDRQRRETTNSTSQTNPTEGLPLPATSRNDGATPIIIPLDQDLDQDITSPRPSFATVYSQFYFLMICLIFLSFWALTWPRKIRSFYVNLLAFIYLSFWIPQIYRNIIRNCRKALNWEYVLGTSISRLFTILYWYFDKQNILFTQPSPGIAFFLIGWAGLQVLVMIMQELLGPRFFVKNEWCPPAYDYHPILSDVDINGITIGQSASSESKGRKVFDCAICMNEIDISGNSTWLEKGYMVTPCRHIFHSTCLEGWMDLRLACPVCRETLPAL